jgi:hypothetical protein
VVAGMVISDRPVRHAFGSLGGLARSEGFETPNLLIRGSARPGHRCQLLELERPRIVPLTSGYVPDEGIP